MQIRQEQMKQGKPKSPECIAKSSGVSSGLAVRETFDGAIADKKPVTATLRNLCKGESVDFPWEQRTSVMVVANRLRKELARIGWDYSYCDDEDKFIVKITRMA